MSSSSASLMSNLQSRGGDLLQKAGPLLLLLGQAANQAFPYFQNAYLQALSIWALLQPYHPEELVTVFFGLVLAFFGGHFFTLFAAIEAYRLCGYEQTKEHLNTLYQNYSVVWEENNRDNLRDDNNDGIPDVKQIDGKELFTRKLSLILKSVDPSTFTMALSGLWMGFLSVVAILRLKFAQTIALGATVGNILETAIGSRLLTPIILHAIPQTHQKWVPVIVSYICKVVGVSIAWTVQRVISAFYSSIRGASLFVTGLMIYLKKRGGNVGKVVAATGGDGNESGGYFIFMGLVAWTGFVWQVRSGFSLPFPLNVLLFPLSLMEWFITWMVAVEN